ncbi:MAG: hypothetical protein SFX73_16735 [Kofleriaceae bacterium]|nr:hypothetical protein [Kofleriaceae bacterium]
MKAVVLFGIIVKAVVARDALAAVVGALVLYVAIGLGTVGVFHRTWPLLSSYLGRAPTLSTVLSVIGAQVAACVAVWLVGSRRYEKGAPRREIADLMLLVVIITAAQLGWAFASA